MGAQTITSEVPPDAEEPSPQRVAGDPESDIRSSKTPAPRRRRWIFLALLLLAGVIVFLPAIRSQYILDDYLHASMIDGTYPAKRGPLDLYDFINDVDRPALTERGLLPWWAHPRLKIRFFRPLPSALRWADQRIFGRAPLVLHLHSMVWWVAAVVAARRLFKRLLSPRAALFATAIFALAPSHALPIAWLANREALVSLSLGLFAIDAYLRWREERSTSQGALALALFTLAVSGGEYAICLAGYILAYELVTRGEGLWRRATGLFPFVAPTVAYLVVRARLGYGTEGSGFYTDPFREPIAFLQIAPRRFLTLLAQGWLTFDTETVRTTTPWWLLALIVLVSLAIFAVPIRRAFAELDDARRRTATWLLLGSFLALAPVLAVYPSPRLLGASSIGIAATVAILFEHAWWPAVPQPPYGVAEWTSFAAITLGFTQLVHGPGTAWLTGRNHARIARDFVADAGELRARLGDLSHADVLVLRGSGGSFFMPFALDPRGVPPLRWRTLSETGHVLALRRGPRTLDLVISKEAGMFWTGSGPLFRSEAAPIKVGDVFKLRDLRVTVLDIGAHGPRAVRVDLDRDLEAAEVAWMHETTKGFADAALPKPGFGQPFDP